MKIITYDFVAPNMLEMILCKILISYNINYCSIKDDNYIEIHFDNYIIKINHDENITFFNTEEFLVLIFGITKNKEKQEENVSKKRLASTFKGVYDSLFDFVPDISNLELPSNNNKYKDINYISKKKHLRASNKMNKTNTKRR